MCGRYRLLRRKQLVDEYFGSVSEEWEPRSSIAPTQPVPVIRQNPNEPVRDLRRLVGQLWVGGDFKLFALCDRRYWAVATGSSYRRSPVGGRTYRASPTSSRIRRTCSWIMESRLRVGSWSKRMSIS